MNFVQQVGKAVACDTSMYNSFLAKNKLYWLSSVLRQTRQQAEKIQPLMQWHRVMTVTTIHQHKQINVHSKPAAAAATM